ncbi:MAG: 3-oxoacyl-[acyl-carrier protein] reductase [Bacteroidetes bacterium]|jgi:3-oxoacyl-[acyl-carrier protein] reductase|nr:3-oxoacyl-[acyl-carrier protein] reductase [Bacteroidota bacterium]
MASNFKLLAGKTAVITGCNRGIGKAILESYAVNGASVFACVRKESPAFLKLIQQLSEKNSVSIVPVYFDSRNHEELKLAVQKIKDSKQKVDVLVNNSGIGYNALFQMSPHDKLKDVFDVNFIAPFIFTQYLTKLMVRQKSGSIITISSTAALDANDGKSVYGASKAALICMTKVIASELKSFGIRANSIAPGMTDTDMLSCLPEELISKVRNQNGQNKIAKPSEIADAALFLASDLSTHITGQVIRVDGGVK